MNRERKLLWSLWCGLPCLVLACTKSVPATLPAGEPEVVAGRQHTFPASDAAGLVKDCWGEQDILTRASAYWDPTAEDIAALETRLPAFLRTQPHSYRRLRGAAITHDPADYVRQYLGGVINGKRVILVNAFHTQALAQRVEFIAELEQSQPAQWQQLPPEVRRGDVWHHRLVCAWHGGDYYFQLAYRLHDSTFIAFGANTPR